MTILVSLPHRVTHRNRDIAGITNDALRWYDRCNRVWHAATAEKDKNKTMRGILGIEVTVSGGLSRGWVQPSDSIEAKSWAEWMSGVHGWAIVDIDRCDGTSESIRYTKGKKD